MTTGERRKEIMKILKSSEDPIKGTELAKRFDVSRQVIVQDIALLRAEGSDVLATSMGYMVTKHYEGKILKTVLTKHFNLEEVRVELMTMVNNGATVVDVVVDHPVYGDVQGFLNVSNKSHVDKFIDKVESGNTEFLSSLTEGVHIHTIAVPDEESFIKIKEELKEKGLLVEE